MPLDDDFIMRFDSLEKMVCRDCVFRKEASGICYVYEDHKPLRVLDGGPCEAYEKEE